MRIFIFLVSQLLWISTFDIGIAAKFSQNFKGVGYEVIEYSESWHFKSVIKIRLKNKIPEDMLRDFALMLKKNEKKVHDKTFILYYLPTMEVESGAWATTHFTPSLEVKIIGLTTEAENNLLSVNRKNNEEIVGRWIDDLDGAVYTFHKRNGEIFRSRKFKDGSGSEIQLSKKVIKGQEFLTEENILYLIKKDGNLKVYYMGGVDFTLRALND